MYVGLYGIHRVGFQSSGPQIGHQNYTLTGIPKEPCNYILAKEPESLGFGVLDIRA